MKETPPPSPPPTSDLLMQEETTATTKQHRATTSTETLTPSDSLMVEATANKRQQLLPAPVTHVPFDLVVEILCRLPVKFLLQFRCVCKSWNSLISKDHRFFKKHLLLSTKRKHLVTSSWTHGKDLSVMSYSIDSIFTSETATQLDYTPINTDDRDHLIASCDGLICFAINKYLAVVWNPSIRKLKKLPSLELPPEYGFTIYGFGYDPFIHNYKVVSVFCYDFKYDGVYTNGCKTQVKAHTLGTHSWRRIKDFPALFPYNQPGIIVNGTANWFAYSNVSGYFSRTIVSLDLEKECYHEIPQPNYGITNSLTLGMLKDCLCVFSHSYTFNYVWLMKEYGNKESWVKLIRVPNFGGTIFSKILYVSEEDNHVLLVFKENDKLKLVVSNSKDDTIKTFKIQDWSSVESNIYVESLISP